MRKRNVQILFRLSEEEADYRCSLAERSGHSRQALLQSMVMGYRLCEKPDPEFYKIMRELSAIVLEMLATLNTLDRERGCLIDISADGSIDPDELADFLRIQRELEQISRTVEALQLWAEKMMADGRIDRAAYTREISAAGEK